jgi:NAD(P)-dependent dehydrogenase (short-subunit alcohol dehydrogenase family)
MKRDLRGRRLLITGASGGIGRCLAEQAADVLAVPADVTSDADRKRLLAAAVERFGGLDVLVNNAGVASFAHFSDSTEEVLRQVMEVNFFAAAELIRLAIPVLVQGRQPAVVNVASMCGRRGMPAWPEYSASKHALCGLTEALRGELARFDIDVLLIVPGLTRSDLDKHLLRKTGRAKIGFDRGMAPEEVARGILRAVYYNRTETVLGWDARWMLRVQRFFPRLVDRLLARKVRQLYETKTPAATTQA